MARVNPGDNVTLVGRVVNLRQSKDYVGTNAGWIASVEIVGKGEAVTLEFWLAEIKPLEENYA